MGKYADMARSALQAQEKAKADAKRQSEAGERNRQEARKAEQDLLETHVLVALRDAAKDFQAENVEVQVGTGESILYPEAILVVGHNRVGRTGNRVAKLSARVEGELIKIMVESGNGPRREWAANPDEGVPVDEAISDALNRWTEQGYPNRNRP